MIKRRPNQSNSGDWPDLPLSAWADTCATLHLWTQVVGKIRLAHAPMVNHWWQVPLYVTSRGLTTSAMPHGARNFQIDFDFIDHQLRIEASDGRRDSIPLIPRPVADFYADAEGRGQRRDRNPVEIAGAKRLRIQQLVGAEHDLVGRGRRVGLTACRLDLNDVQR